MRFIKIISLVGAIVFQPAFAQTMNSLNIDPGEKLLNQSIRVSIDFTSEKKPACGLRVNWGDGRSQTIRVGHDGEEGAPASPINLNIIYGSPGKYNIEIKGEYLRRGLGSVGACDVKANAVTVAVVDSETDQKEQPAQTTSVAQVAKEALLRKWKDTGFPVSQLPFCAPNVFNKCFGSGKTSNGDEYIGDFDNGQLVGRGIAIFSNGDKYVGEHNKGINGQGIYYFSRPGFQGTILVGEYRDNIPSGNGIYFNADGRVGESGLYSSNLIEFRFVDPAIFTRIPLGKIPIISSADRVAIEIKQSAITKKQAEDQRGAALLKQEAAEVKARQDPATKESQQPSGSFIYVSKLTPDQIRSKFFGSDEWKIRINHFLLNYRFIEYFPILVNSNLEGAHILKTQFQPYLSDMVKAKDEMDNVLKNFAKSLNVQPEIIYRAFGIVYDNQGKIIESYGGSLATGRKMATDYFYRRPINDFFDSRDPRSLFTGWYPQLISSFNSDVPQILALAVSTEAKLKKEYLDAEQAAEQTRVKRQEEERARREEERARQEFLNSPEGQRKIAKEQKEERFRQEQFANDYPYYAVITCGVHFPVYACFSGRVKTELELRNGNDYKMYTLVDIMQIPQNQTGIAFNLRNKFELKMQNSDENLILNLKVYNRLSNSLVYEKSATRFGVIRFSN